MKKITTTSKSEAFQILHNEITNKKVYDELYNIINDIFSNKTFNISLFVCGSSDIIKFNMYNDNLFDLMKKKIKEDLKKSYTIKTLQKFKNSDYLYTIVYSDNNNDSIPKFVLLNVWC